MYFLQEAFTNRDAKTSNTAHQYRVSPRKKPSPRREGNVHPLRTPVTLLVLLDLLSAIVRIYLTGPQLSQSALTMQRPPLYFPCYNLANAFNVSLLEYINLAIAIYFYVDGHP